MMESKFKIGATLIIIDGPDKSKIGKEVTVINTFHFIRNTKVSAEEVWEYKVKDGVKSSGWIPEYHLETLNKTS